MVEWVWGWVGEWLGGCNKCGSSGEWFSVAVCKVLDRKRLCRGGGCWGCGGEREAVTSLPLPPPVREKAQ